MIPIKIQTPESFFSPWAGHVDSKIDRKRSMHEYLENPEEKGLRKGINVSRKASVSAVMAQDRQREQTDQWTSRPSTDGDLVCE